MTTAKLILAGLLALTFSTSSTEAQVARTVCGERDDIITALTDRFGETQRSWGMGPGNRIVEVYTSDETGSWTITITSPNGTTCLMAAGELWEDLVQEAAGEAI